MRLSELINIDEEILGETPVFKGTRVPVQNLFDYIEAGDSIDEFWADFDYIPKEYCIALIKEFRKEN